MIEVNKKCALQVRSGIVKSSGCEEFVLKDMDSDETGKEQKDQLRVLQAITYMMRKMITISVK